MGSNFAGKEIQGFMSGNLEEVGNSQGFVGTLCGFVECPYVGVAMQM